MTLSGSKSIVDDFVAEVAYGYGQTAFGAEILAFNFDDVGRPVCFRMVESGNNFAGIGNYVTADFAVFATLNTVFGAGCSLVAGLYGVVMFCIGDEPCIAAVVADIKDGAGPLLGCSVITVCIAEYPRADVFVLARFGAVAANAFDLNFLGLAVGISYNEALLGFIPSYGSDANAGRTLFALFALVAVITCGTLFALFALKIPEVDFFLRAIGIVYDELTIHNAHVDYAFCGVGIAIASGYAEREGYNTAKCAENPENLC